MNSIKEYKDTAVFFVLTYLPLVWIIYEVAISVVLYIVLLMLFNLILIYFLYPHFIKFKEINSILISLKEKRKHYVIILLFLFLLLNFFAFISNSLNLTDYNLIIIILNFIYLILHMVFIIQSFNLLIKENFK